MSFLEKHEDEFITTKFTDFSGFSSWKIIFSLGQLVNLKLFLCNTLLPEPCSLPCTQ